MRGAPGRRPASTIRSPTLYRQFLFGEELPLPAIAAGQAGRGWGAAQLSSVNSFGRAAASRNRNIRERGAFIRRPGLAGPRLFHKQGDPPSQCFWGGS